MKQELDLGGYGSERRMLVYRLVCRAMLVEGLPEELNVGGVWLQQQVHPLTTQRTTLDQQPGIALAWRKRIERSVQMGAGVAKTICMIPINEKKNAGSEMTLAREKALCVLGFLAAILDERIALEEMFEDLIVINLVSGEKTPVLDDVRQVRSFMPRIFHKVEETAIASLHDVQTRDTPVSMAARWYLAAAQMGPRPDAIVSFWVAIEALVPDARGEKVVNHVEAALRDTRFDMMSLPITVERLSNIRGNIVRGGNETPDDLVDAFHSLETIVRQLVRSHLGVLSGWPSRVSANNWPEPIDGIINDLREPDRHRTHDEEDLGAEGLYETLKTVGDGFIWPWE